MSNHDGPCDEIYGCPVCWNEANDGQGYVAVCDGCRQQTYTLITTVGVDELHEVVLCSRCRERALEENK